jgi:hypothetical protein
LKEAKEKLKKLEGIAKKNESAARNPLPPNFMARPNKKMKYCCFVNCPNTTLDKSLTFASVPTQLLPTRTHKLGMKQRELFRIGKRRFM